MLDNFEKIVYKSSKSYYILRSKNRECRPFLFDMVVNSMKMVLIEKNVDRRSVLYNRKGHKGIQIKRVIKAKSKKDTQKLKKLDEKI